MRLHLQTNVENHVNQLTASTLMKLVRQTTLRCLKVLFLKIQRKMICGLLITFGTGVSSITRSIPIIFVPHNSLINRPGKLKNFRFGWLGMLVRLEARLVPSTLHLLFLLF